MTHHWVEAFSRENGKPSTCLLEQALELRLLRLAVVRDVNDMYAIRVPDGYP